jgi:phosphoserine phosphatase
LYVEPLAVRLGFDEVVCTRVGRDRRHALTGELIGGNCKGEEKVRRLRRMSSLDGLYRFAYSDHPADWPLLEWADRAVAVNPSRSFARQARARNVTIVRW